MNAWIITTVHANTITAIAAWWACGSDGPSQPCGNKAIATNSRSWVASKIRDTGWRPKNTAGKEIDAPIAGRAGLCSPPVTVTTPIR